MRRRRAQKRLYNRADISLDAPNSTGVVPRPWQSPPGYYCRQLRFARYLQPRHIGARVMKTRSLGESVSICSKSRSLLGLLGVAIMWPASAGIQNNTIDPAGTISHRGHHVVLTGPIACTLGQRADLQVTLTQRATGAIASGKTHFTCTGYMQQWEVRASSQGRETFRPGAATATALGTTSTHGSTNDAHQWLEHLTLVY